MHSLLDSEMARHTEPDIKLEGQEAESPLFILRKYRLTDTAQRKDN